MTNEHELKGLQTRKHRIEIAIKELNNKISSDTRRLQQLKHELKKIKLAIKQASTNIIISEHAQLRYIQRVLGLKTDDMKKAILPDAVRSQIKALGDGTYPVNEYFQIKVKNNVVVTLVN